MRPGDWLVCAFVEPPRVGATFRTWPLHVTIVPWFRLALDVRQLSAELQKAWASSVPFVVHMGEENVLFGHQPGKHATLVQLPTPLVQLEKRLRDLLHRQDAWLVDESTRARHDFRPHVTAQKLSALHRGESFWCDRLFVVEQIGEHKVVAAEVRLAP